MRTILELVVLGSGLVLMVQAHASMLKDEAIKEAFESAKQQVRMEEPPPAEAAAENQRSGCMRHRLNSE